MFTVKDTKCGILLESKELKIKILPLDKNIFRVCCTKKEFSNTESLIVNNILPLSNYSTTEKDKSLFINSGDYTLSFNKQSGSIRVADKCGKTIYSENEHNSKELLEFDSYKNVFDFSKNATVDSNVDGARASSDEFTTVFNKKLYKCTLRFDFSQDEAIYGFGSHEEGFGNLRGKYRELYQQNLKACVPYFYSTNGYGCLFDANCFMTFHDDKSDASVWLDAVEQLDYYIICGSTFDEVTGGYRSLTGGTPMLPKWAFGYCQSKERYKDADELISVVKEYRKRKIPLDLIILDWMSWDINGGWGQKTFDKNRFPDPRKMIDDLHNLNSKFMISIWPIMTDGCPNQIEMKNEGCMLGNQSTYNAFDEKARNLYWKQANEGLFANGVDAWWCDCTEPFENDWSGEVKPEPEERILLNTSAAKKYIEEQNISAYSLMHSKGIYEGQRKITDKKRVLNLTRSAYAGQHRYSTITWAGDTVANWDTLKRHIPEGINFCASGEPYWTVDIGAFFVKESDKWFYKGEYPDGCSDLAYRELYTRWLQYGAFLPMFRSHGTDTPREIWNFGEKGTMFYDTIEKFIKLRYSLLPYIYSIAARITHENYTMIRALAFDFKDENVKNIDNQFMFGDAIMVCPITRPMYYTHGSKPIKSPDKNYTIYLPDDADWYDFWTNEFYKGGQYITKEYGIDTMPLFVKSGSIIPMTKAMQFVDEDKNADYEIKVYPGNDAEFSIYEDEGDNYNYENGKYSWTPLSWNEKEQNLIIHSPIGEFDGMVRNREYKVNIIKKK